MIGNYMTLIRKKMTRVPQSLSRRLLSCLIVTMQRSNREYESKAPAKAEQEAELGILWLMS